MEVRTKISFVMPTENDYKLMAKLSEMIFKNKDSWLVDEYDEKNKRIEMKEALATKDDAVEMVLLLDQFFSDRPSSKTRDILMGVEYKVIGTTVYSNSGEQFDFIIERKKDSVTIQETESYYFFGFGYFEDYEEFCDELADICDDPQELIPEDEFDPDFEYAVTRNKIYVDDTPSYCERRPILR